MWAKNKELILSPV